MRISPSDIAARRGFTLLEMLIVLAVLGLVMSIVVPNIRMAMSQNARNTAFFELQSQMTELRARAYRQKQALVLVDSGRFTDDPEADPSPVEARFIDNAWAYRLSEPLIITSGGVCNEVTADLYQKGRMAMRLQSQPDCSFRRVQ